MVGHRFILQPDDDAVPHGDVPIDVTDTVDPAEATTPTNILAQCPYCGVGCGTMIQTEKGKIVGVMPDPRHPTNKGLQCIKGLASAEAIYVDRLSKPLIRKDMTDILTGHVSETKGRFDPEVFREASWEEAEEVIVKQIVGIVQQHGGRILVESKVGQEASASTAPVDGSRSTTLPL